MPIHLETPRLTVKRRLLFALELAAVRKDIRGIEFL